MKPGYVARVEFDYIRHATQPLIANFEVASGQLIAPSIGPTRTEGDVAAHLAQTLATDPAARWIFITDNLNIHQSEALLKLVAALCHRQAVWGVKEKCGILLSMTTPATFLSDPTHRIRFVYPPKHCSCLNQVEMWVSILVRRVLKRSSFASVDELRQRMLHFIAFFNITAMPFKWNYMARPLHQGACKVRQKNKG